MTLLCSAGDKGVVWGISGVMVGVVFISSIIMSSRMYYVVVC